VLPPWHCNRIAHTDFHQTSIFGNILLSGWRKIQNQSSHPTFPKSLSEIHKLIRRMLALSHHVHIQKVVSVQLGRIHHKLQLALFNNKFV
jgi:hypothetical protein